MGLRIVDKKFASAIAIAGAVSLASVPAFAAGDRQPGAPQQPGAAQSQMERQPGQEMHQRLSSEQIREMQEKLRDEGHNPGPIDGIWGPQTQTHSTNVLRRYGISRGTILNNNYNWRMFNYATLLHGGGRQSF
jgi:peptidoglycan hydrolase-like protein with peptidoglycan-binding domain